MKYTTVNSMNELTIELLNNALLHIDSLKSMGVYFSEEIDVQALGSMEHKLTHLLTAAIKERLLEEENL